MTIPKRLVRTVPAETSSQTEQWWRQACELHPDWEHVTLRDPVDRDLFPLTRHLFDTCETGAQLADLIRTEDLWWRGGLYIDSDVEVFKPFDTLLGVAGFAGWEDEHHICNACIGFKAGHPALEAVIKYAIQRHHQGTWHAGVGAFTDVMKQRDDVLLLPPGSLYPVHWREAHKHPIDVEKVRAENPWTYAVHMYQASWHHDKIENSPAPA